ncbi:MAG: mechanosensitive ion channel [Cyanobacteria bacterium RM1_2_2]|nr:mechanosensitive ion channel [Cyanobacteria bacterium RM1_2_2]
MNFTQKWNLSARSLLNTGLVGLLVFALLTTSVPTLAGNLPVLQIWEQQLRSSDYRVQRLGNLEVTPVEFDGAELFTLAAPTVWDRTNPGNQLPVEIRAKQVTANLDRVIEGSFIHGKADGILTNFDPKTLQVSVISLNEVPVIIASDSYHSQPLKIVTVTHLDADYNGQPVAQLAEQWRSIVYQKLYESLMERSPQALSLRGKLGESGMTLALTLAASLVLWFLQVPLKRRNRKLRLQQAAIAATVAPDVELGSSTAGLLQFQASFLDAFQQQISLQRQRGIISYLRWLLAWGQIALWLGGLALALTLFPWTRQYARQLLGMPTLLLVIWFLTGAVNRMGSILLHLMAAAWVRFGVAAADDPERDQLRIFTILSAVKPLKTFLVYFGGVVAILVYLGIPLSLVMTVSAIIGLAVLLVCQSLVKDWIMGLLILWENQYAIGDVIAIQNYTGLVERMNLRLTQLHSLTGGLVSLANGSLTQVENLTRRWRQHNSQVARMSQEPEISQAEAFTSQTSSQEKLGKEKSSKESGLNLNGAEASIRATSVESQLGMSE